MVTAEFWRLSFLENRSVDQTETGEFGAEFVVDLCPELHAELTQIVSGDAFISYQHLTELFDVVAFVEDVPFEVV